MDDFYYMSEVSYSHPLRILNLSAKKIKFVLITALENGAMQHIVPLCQNTNVQKTLFWAIV